MFCKFSAEVINKGASLKIVNEHYLDIGNGKAWRDSVKAHIKTLVDLERKCYERLVRGLKLNKASAQFLADIIGGYSVSVLPLAFCNDGILHRGVAFHKWASRFVRGSMFAFLPSGGVLTANAGNFLNTVQIRVSGNSLIVLN